MQREVKKYLFDILQACNAIETFIIGKKQADFESDELLRSAVERKFEIAGEALSQLLKVDPLIADLVTDAPKIIAFRNRLIHGYDQVSQDLVWAIITRDLPLLTREVNALLNG